MRDVTRAFAKLGVNSEPGFRTSHWKFSRNDREAIIPAHGLRHVVNEWHVRRACKMLGIEFKDLGL